MMLAVMAGCASDAAKHAHLRTRCVVEVQVPAATAEFHASERHLQANGGHQC